MKGVSLHLQKIIRHLILMSCINVLIVTRKELAQGQCPLSQPGTKSIALSVVAIILKAQGTVEREAAL